MEKVTVVSADGHMGVAADVYRPYLDAAYRDFVDDLIEEDRINTASFAANRAGLSIPGVYEVGHEAIDVGSDVKARLAAQDAEGVAAEILLSGSDHVPPFFTVLNRPYPADVRAAGVRAYHRWVVDAISEADGRLLGVGYPGEITDMDESLAELRWVAERGFVSVFIPGYVADPSRPPIFDRSYDRFWAACADHGLVVNMHAGSGMPQGVLFEAFRLMAGGESLVGFDLKTMGENMKKSVNLMDANTEASPFALDMGPRQVLWQLMLSGVFDRHPSLKFVLTEVRADWIPATLSYLDERFANDASHLKLSASEYFVRNCAVTPSTPHRVEIEMRDEIGVDQFLFGADIPHAESTWPHTREFLRDAFAGVSESDARKILGENAIRFFNLDRAHLDEIASRIGPTADEVLAGPAIDARIVDSLDARAGYLKPLEQVSTAAVDERLASDLVNIARS